MNRTGVIQPLAALLFVGGALLSPGVLSAQEDQRSQNSPASSQVQNAPAPSDQSQTGQFQGGQNQPNQSRSSGEQSQSQDNQHRTQHSQQGNQTGRHSAQDDDDDTVYRGIEHAVLGVMLSERQGQGTRIRDLLTGSPAERAGLRVGDRILKIDGKDVNSYRDVIHIVNRAAPGQTANITVNRNGEEKVLRVTFASYDDLYSQDSEPPSWREHADARSGQQQGERYDRQSRQSQAGRRDTRRQGYDEDAQRGRWNEPRQYQTGRADDDQSPTWQRQNSRDRDHDRYYADNQRSQPNGNQRRRYSPQYSDRDEDQGILGIDLQNQRRAIVRDARQGSPAEQAGLRPGDEIVAVGGEDIEDRDDLMDELQDYRPGQQVRLTIVRHGEERVVRVRLTSQRELMNQNQSQNSPDRGGQRYQYQTGDRSDDGDDSSNRRRRGDNYGQRDATDNANPRDR